MDIYITPTEAIKKKTTPVCENVLTLQKKQIEFSKQIPEYQSNIYFRKSHQISQICHDFYPNQIKP